MSQGILPFPVLQRMCRPEGPLPRVTTVQRWATRERIRYGYDGNGGIYSTVDAVNAALGLGVASEKPTSAAELI